MQERKKREKVNRITVKYTVLMLVSVFISSISQVLLKKAAMRHYDSVIQEYFNLKVIIGYVLFAATSLLAVLAYRVIPLSMGSVLEATSYIYVTVFGAAFFVSFAGALVAFVALEASATFVSAFLAVFFKETALSRLAPHSL